MNNNQQHIVELLEKKQIKPTFQRVIILDYIIKTKDHPTADMIYNHIKAQYPTISLATVYNTLDLFEQYGLVRAIKVQHEKCRYDFANNDHLHLYITDKNEVIDIFDKELIDFIKRKLIQYNFENFQIDNISIEIKKIGDKQ